MKAFKHENVRKILLRAVNWVGDAVMTTPAIGVIREHFPHAEITLLANPMVAQLFSPHPWIDHVITFDRNGSHKGIIGRLRLATQLRRHAFDLAVIMPNSFDSALIPWLAGIPLRLGKSSDGRGFMLSDNYTPDATTAGCHEVEYYIAMLKHFGITGKTDMPFLATTPAEDSYARTLLRNHNILDDDFVIGINPGATFGSAKRWYPERFAEVATRLSNIWSAKVVIFGGPGETDIAADIEQKISGNCLNVAGKTNVRELLALIHRCNFFITNDSGPMHIAAAFNIPLVAVFGSTDHTTTSPYTDSAVIVRKKTECAPCKLRECPTDHKCMTGVSADDVIKAAINLLNHTKAS